MSASAIVILLVEDDPSDRTLFLYAAGKVACVARIGFARDGEEATAYLEGRGQFADRERHPFPDLVVLDLNLPRLSGLDVLRWMRARPELKGMPVTILSSSAETRDIEAAYALGANSYLVKTSDLIALNGVVRGLCEQAHIRSEFRMAGRR